MDIVNKINEVLKEGKFPSLIDFSYYTGEDRFGADTPEYRELEKINTFQNWEKYQTEMLSVGTFVEYDNINDEYVVRET